MADYAPVTASVATTETTGLKSGIFGEAVIAGDVLYVSTADSSLYKADADLATNGANVPVGIALNPGAAGQRGQYQTGGTITLGAGVFTAAGEVVALSHTAGKLCPVADPTTGDRLVLMGWSLSTSTMHISIVDTTLTR